MYPGQRSGYPTSSVAQPNPFASGPTTATASIQVHYLWVAGRYRDLSSERGLGLAGEAHSLGPIPELGDHSDHSGSRPASTYQPITSAVASAQLSAGGTLSQDSIPERKINPFLDIRNFSADAGAKAAARTTGVHGARHGSLRSYAADRLKSQELLESRISRTTDVERLKWEAKSALLNNAHSLAVLLFIRAGTLGSISSCVTLAKIYASGVTRGSSPRIIVIRRDPLRALAWDLEAFRLLQRRLEPAKYGAGIYSKASSSSSTSEAWSAENPQGLEETFRCCELLIRLLRTEQVGLASASNDAVALPDIKAQHRLKSAPGSASSHRTQPRRNDIRLLWDEVSAVIRWLETRLERSVALARHRASQIDNVADPDDEFDHDETAEYLEALAVQLAYLRAVQALRIALQVRSKESLRAAKERWAQSLAAASSSHCPAGMDDVVPLAEAGLAFVHALPEDGSSEAQQAGQTEAMRAFSARMEEGMAELSVPTVTDVPTGDGKENGGFAKSTQTQSQGNATSASSTTTSDPASKQSPKKSKSLQEMNPVDMETASEATRSKQLNLNQRLIAASQPAAAGIVSVEARGQQHIPRNSNTYNNAFGEPLGHGRATSIAGLTTASFVGHRLTSPSIIGLDGSSTAGLHRDPFLAPTREPEGFAFPRHRRPSSVVSDTPSLLFGPSPDQGSPTHEGDKALGEIKVAEPTRPAFDRKRVVSMYGITPASGSKSSSAPAEGVAFPSHRSLQQQEQTVRSPVHTRTHRSPSNTTAQDALTSTLQRNQPVSSAASLFLSSQHGRTMSGQASEHLRKLRQQDAASMHSRVNSDAMSTLSRTLSRRQGSEVGSGIGVGAGAGTGRSARPASLFLAPSVSLRSLSTAPLPNSLQAQTSPTLSRPSGSASSALNSLRKVAPTSPQASQAVLPSAKSQPDLSAASGAGTGTGPGTSARSTVGKAGGAKGSKGRPAPLARTFDSLDPTSRPGSGPHSPLTSPRLGQDGVYSPSPSASAGALSPRATSSTPGRGPTAKSSLSASSSSNSHAQQLDAALAEAEAKSRLHTEGTCSICGTLCENAPVSKTGQRWCSRDCRMEAKRRAAAGSEPATAPAPAPAPATTAPSESKADGVDQVAVVAKTP
ncbi:hypothetical protein V8E36_000206 [Tilletia maclaganii]